MFADEVEAYTSFRSTNLICLLESRKMWEVIAFGETTSAFKNLGVIFDSKVKFNLYVDATVKKDKFILCFVKRLSKEFKDPYVCKR